MADKDYKEELGFNAATIASLRSRQTEYLRKALASGMMSQAEFERRLADYNPDETGLEDFSVTREDLNAVPTAFAKYASEQNSQRMATGGKNALPDGEAEAEVAANMLFGFGSGPERRSAVPDIGNVFGEAAPAAKFELRGSQSGDFNSVGAATSRELIKIAQKVVTFEKDNSDILPSGWRKDPVLSTEVARIIATSDGLDVGLVKEVIRDMEE